MSTASLIEGDPRALPARRISAETCTLFDYVVGVHKGRPVQAAGYRAPEGGPVLAQKVRFPDKDFTVLGDLKSCGLFGQHLWREAGKMVVVTEGEIDAMTVSQLQGNKWPVVSLPNGASGARKSLAAQLQWLLGFDSVVLMFDNDDPGRKAASDCGTLFPAGRCKIATIPGFKDPNEALQAGKGDLVIAAIWGAKDYRPDGLLSASDLAEAAVTDPEVVLPWAIPALSALTYGRRLGEVIAIGAGTGVGKTDFLSQQVAYDVDTLGEGVGLFFLEQAPRETLLRVAGKLMGKRFHVPDAGWSEEERAEGVRRLVAQDGVYFYNSFGSTSWDSIRDLIRYLAHHAGTRLFYLDHLTALAAAEDDERKALEHIMAEMASVAQELQIVIHFVSHLATPEGKPHEEGGRVMVRHFKGSRAIGFWSHFMLGLERDQQADDPDERSTLTLRVLKDRFTGQATGRTLTLGYEPDTGRLFEREASPSGIFTDTTTAESDF